MFWGGSHNTLSWGGWSQPWEEKGTQNELAWKPQSWAPSRLTLCGLSDSHTCTPTYAHVCAHIHQEVLVDKQTPKSFHQCTLGYAHVALTHSCVHMCSHTHISLCSYTPHSFTYAHLHMWICAHTHHLHCPPLSTSTPQSPHTPTGCSQAGLQQEQR